MPFGHDWVGTSHGTLLPCPVASLAPMAVYTMVDPAAGGAAVEVGAVIPLQAANNVATSRATTTCRPIREIGREELMRKNVQRECRMKSMALTRMTWFAWQRCCVTFEAAAHARGHGRGGGSRNRRDGVRKQRAGRREAAAW